MPQKGKARREWNWPLNCV